MAALRINALPIGSEVTLHFLGSRRLGNDPHSVEAVLVSRVGAGETRRIGFCTDGTDEPDVEVYRYNNRWAYGTSAERLKFSIS